MAETLGSIMDKLIVVNLKIWHNEETAHVLEADDAVVADAKRKINILNNQRNALIQEYDELVAAIVFKNVKPHVFPQLKDYSRR